jgi:hypothetical protein
MAGVGRTPCRPVAAEDIRDLQCRAGHERGLLGRRPVFLTAPVGFLGSLALWPRQAVKRALHPRDQAGGDVGIARRRLNSLKVKDLLRGILC